jgi:hypothetical protein
MPDPDDDAHRVGAPTGDVAYRDLGAAPGVAGWSWEESGEQATKSKLRGMMQVPSK